MLRMGVVCGGDGEEVVYKFAERLHDAFCTETPGTFCSCHPYNNILGLSSVHFQGSDRPVQWLDLYTIKVVCLV